jgi:hypothetical protein
MEQILQGTSSKIIGSSSTITSTNDGSVVGLPSNSNSSSSEDKDTQKAIVMQEETTLWESIPQQPQQQQQQPLPNPASQTEKKENGGGDKDDRTMEPPLPPPTASTMEARIGSTTRVTDVSSLEERVQELEIKLATLSRFLHQQQRLSAKNLVRKTGKITIFQNFSLVL